MRVDMRDVEARRLNERSLVRLGALLMSAAISNSILLMRSSISAVCCLIRAELFSFISLSMRSMRCRTVLLNSSACCLIIPRRLEICWATSFVATTCLRGVMTWKQFYTFLNGSIKHQRTCSQFGNSFLSRTWLRLRKTCSSSMIRARSISTSSFDLLTISL